MTRKSIMLLAIVVLLNNSKELIILTTVKFLSQVKLSVISWNKLESVTMHSNDMTNEIYSLGGYCFYSAKELADFKINFPNDWEEVKNKPLKKSGLQVESLQDFVDYLDSLQKQPDLCLAYRFDSARGYGYYTTLWCNGLEIIGIFGYHDDDNIHKHLVFEMVSQSKWTGMKVRQNYCR